MSRFAEMSIDATIVRRAAAGDAKAHAIIYRAFASPVYSLCLRFTRVPAHAEDLVQETFIEIMRSIATFRGDASPGTWIRRVAVTKSLMFLRSAWTSRSHGSRCGKEYYDATDLSFTLTGWDSRDTGGGTGVRRGCRNPA